MKLTSEEIEKIRERVASTTEAHQWYADQDFSGLNGVPVYSEAECDREALLSHISSVEAERDEWKERAEKAEASQKDEDRRARKQERKLLNLDE